MRLAVVADLHGHLPAVPPCDLLLLAGDLVPASAHGDGEQAHWLDTTFRHWLDEVPAKAVVGIAGNHDFLFARDAASVPEGLRWTYLEDSGCTAGGLKVWGSPWTPWFHDWAFNAPQEDGEAFLAGRYAAADADADVLLIHGPPAGYGDRIVSGARVGSSAELALIDRVSPRLCVFGHIHEDRGSWRHGATNLVNAAAVDVRFQPLADPVVVLEL